MKAFMFMMAMLGSCGAVPSQSPPESARVPVAPAVATSVNPENGWHTVTWTFDGDTIRLEDGTRVRLIGMNAPEMSHAPDWLPDEPCAYAAKQEMFHSVANGVTIEAGEGTQYDIYGRLLAYVWTAQGLLLNASIVQHGKALESYYPTQGNDKYHATILAAQAIAQTTHTCLWP